MLKTATSPPQAPLDRDQLARLTQVVQELGADQLIWASGYLAGLAAARPAATGSLASVPSDPAKGGRQLTIFYGSQTGNARRAAEQALARATSQHLPARLVNLAEYTPRQLKQETAALFVVSTQGDGDPPEDAVAFFEFLNAAAAPRLDKLKYAVLALGDSSYPYFCQAGRALDARLEALGASRLHPRTDCDLDFAGPAEHWTEAALKQAADHVRPAPRIAVVEHLPKLAAPPATAIETTGELLVNQRLTGRGSAKDVRHLEFAVAEGSLPYEPGDGIAVLPKNPSATVAAVLQALRAGGHETVTGPRGNPRPLADVLAEEVELTLLNRQTLEALQVHTGDPALGRLLAADQAAEFAQFVAAHQVADVLRRFPGEFTPEAFVRMLRPLARRTYSIASSRAATPDEAHLLVAVVRDEAPEGPRLGAASNYLATLTPGAEVALHLEANPAFHLPPDDQTPLIMIGPGTGVAPFRAFVAERAARGAPGRHWLFFGERTQRDDFLYQIEWQKALAQGHLTRLDVAFSRDQAAKDYVQHRILEHARECYAWLEDGAAIYVCGDAKRMAKDVHAALLDAIRVGGGLTDDRAREYLQGLQRAGRYRRDVY